MSASLALTPLLPLAKELDKSKVTPGILGFLVFAVMALAVWGLMKSMNRHMGKVDFEEAPDASGEGAGKSSGASGASGAGPGGKASPAKG